VDNSWNGRIQMRDVRGRWSVIATQGFATGQIYNPKALAADAAGNLYISDQGSATSSRIQKRDAQGNWSVIATDGGALGQVQYPYGLAVDGAGNLYVADTDNNRVLKCASGPSTTPRR
jgi:DNA-binding beta-propeller fold protein YncE